MYIYKYINTYNSTDLFFVDLPFFLDLSIIWVIWVLGVVPLKDEQISGFEPLEWHGSA